MSVYSNVTENDLINLHKIAEQLKEQRALKIKNRISKQTHDMKLVESLSPITKKLTEVNKSTKKLGDILKESNSEIGKNQEVVPVEIDSEEEKIQIKTRALPNSNEFSTLMMETLGALMNSKNSLKLIPDDSGRASFLEVPINTLGGDRIQVKGNVYDLTPDLYKALSYTGYTGNTVKKENDILMMNNIIRDIGYTGDGDRESKRKTFLTITLPKLVGEIQKRTFDEFDLEGQGVKIVIPSNIIDINTRLEIFFGLKLSGHTDTLTEASNLIDELYKRGEIQIKQQYRDALNKFSSQ